MMKKLLPLFAITLNFIASAGAQDIDPQKLVKETQQIRQNKNQIDIVWWIPKEFWEHSFQANPVLTLEQQKNFIDIVEQYSIFCILEGTVGTFGGISGTLKSELESKVSLDVSGTTLLPLSYAELSPDASNFLAIMKPGFANMLGQMGQSMEFIVFKGSNVNGKRYLNPHSKEEFTLNLGEKAFKWRLPLACVLPSKYDPETNEEFPGNYMYSPFSGKKLITK